jgi:hypothetical protein
MKRQTQTLILLCVLLTSFRLTAQTQFSNPGRLNFSTGIGLLPSYMKDSRVSNSLPVHFMLGYRVSKKFNLKAFAGFAAATSDPRSFGDGFSTYLENKSWSVGIRGELRHEFLQRLEVYGGAMLGYYAVNIKEYNSSTGELYKRIEDAPTPYNPKASNVKLMYSAFVGTSYFIRKGIGVYGELGYGISLVNIGVTFRI